MRETISCKTIKKHELLASEIEYIVETSKTTKQTHKEVASMFGISHGLVSRLVVSARKDPMFLQSLKKKEAKRMEKLRTVIV